MRPTVDELLTGIAEVLDADVAGHVSDVGARQQLGAATAMLRRLAVLVPKVQGHLLTELDDVVETLAASVPLAPDLDDAIIRLDRARTALDARRCTLHDVQALHQRALAVLDDVVAAWADLRADAQERVDALLRRTVERERDLGASIAGRGAAASAPTTPRSPA